jgi:hypothetical protein
VAAAPFLARERAFANAASAVSPPPAADTRAPTGKFSIGNAPRLFVPRVLGGIAVAVTGLLALIALAVAAGIRKHRRRQVPEVSVIEQMLALRNAMPAAPDGTVVWHDITVAPSDPRPDPFRQ